MIQSVSIAGVAAAAVLFVVVWSSRTPSAARVGLAAVLGSGSGFFLGCWWLGAAPGWPPLEDQDRLLGIVIPSVLLVEAIVAVVPHARWTAPLLRCIVAVGAAPILLYGSSYLSDLAGPGSRLWTPLAALLICSGLAAALSVEWWALLRLAKRGGARTVVLLLAVCCAGGGVTVMLSGYFSGGQIGLPLAAALCGTLIASLIAFPSKRFEAGGLIGLGTVGLYSLLVIGLFFGQLSKSNATLLGMAPVLAWIAEVPAVRRWGDRGRSTVRVIVPAMAVACALIWARQQFVADSARSTSSESNEPSAEDYLNFGK